MDQNDLQKKLDQPMNKALSNATEDTDTPQTDRFAEEAAPSNYQAMGESYSDTTNFEVNKEPGRLN